MEILETNRLTLRPLTLDDADDIFVAYSDAETMRFMSGPPHENASQTRNYLQMSMMRKGCAYWAICEKDSDTALGFVNYLGETRFPGLGYILRRDKWGLGYTTEACRAALAYGFHTLDYDRVELWIDEWNSKSIRVATKLGCSLVGRLNQKYRHRDDYHTMLVYGVWREAMKRPMMFSAEPVLMTHDLASALDFYHQKLGFNIDFVYGDPPDHAGISYADWSGQGVVMQLTQVPAEQEIMPAGYLYIIMSSKLDELCEQYRANGVEIYQEPTNQPWGLREFGIKDLDGQALRFGTHI